MNVEMYLSASQTQGSSIYTMGKAQQKGYEELLKALQNFIQDQVLQSTAYDNAKAFFGDVLVPLAQGGIYLAEAGAEACKQFPEEYIAQVDSVDLKSQELKEQIDALETRIANLDDLAKSINKSKLSTSLKKSLSDSSSRVKEACEGTKRELEHKLRCLLSFHASSPTIFREIAEIKQAIHQGLFQASQSWDANTKSFRRPPGANMDWAKTIRSMYKQKIDPNQIEAEEIFNKSSVGSANYFGGSQMNARDLEEKQGEFLELLKAKFPHKSEEELKELLANLTAEACGYVAVVNAFFMNYTGTPEDFEKTFGFPMYVTLPDGTRVVNHDALILDFYASTVYWKQNADGTLYYNESVDLLGTNQFSRRYRIDKYFGGKGFSITSNPVGEISAETYRKYAKDGKTVILTVCPVNMTRVSDGLEVDYQISDGGHVVTVLGVAENGNLIVSSWGWEWELPVNNEGFSMDDGGTLMEVIDY